MNSEISITANDTIHSTQSVEATARPAITFIHHFIFKLSAIVRCSAGLRAKNGTQPSHGESFWQDQSRDSVRVSAALAMTVPQTEKQVDTVAWSSHQQHKCMNVNES
uniref:Uncharacterized protein n=1 Tax=Anguilla anguilla TaxID=7936 RepID=A0A0E9WS96_ANGAN